ncbi:MAG: hypothetical protein O2904_02310 [bacterium]|nr:hypothetical protein [bacterium]
MTDKQTNRRNHTTHDNIQLISDSDKITYFLLPSGAFQSSAGALFFRVNMMGALRKIMTYVRSNCHRDSNDRVSSRVNERKLNSIIGNAKKTKSFNNLDNDRDESFGKLITELSKE